MANDIDKTSPHYKGDFGSIYEVNKKFPTGGVAGDFVVIEGWAHYWNADRATWCVNAERDSYWDELITNIIEKFKLVRGATYMGVASLDTVPAKVIGAKMYYFATVAGTYKNFGDLAVPQGINVLYSENGSSWVNTTLLEVAQELGVSTKKVVSQKALNDALNLKANQSSVNEALAKKADKEEMNRLLATKANTADVDTKFTEEQKRVDGELDKKFDKESVVQESGEAEDKVMSQNAVSTKLSDLSSVVDKTAIKNEEGTVVETPFRYIQNEEFIFAKVDAEDKLLFGIHWDGTPVFGKTSAVEDRLQSQVTLLAERVATIMGDEDTTNVIDTMNELKKFFAEIENTETLTGILANLDNVAKNLDKTTIKDEAGEIQDTPFRVIENEEFIMAVVDSEDRVLFGIYRVTGKPYYPLNEMYHVEQNEEFFAVWLDAANHVLFGIRKDGQIIGEIHAANALKQVISFLQEKVDTINTSLQELLDVFSLEENPEYLAVEKDADGKVLSATYNDGSHYSHNLKSETIDTKVDKEEGKSLIDSDVAEANSTLEDPEERFCVVTDADGKVLSYRDKNGRLHEEKIVLNKVYNKTGKKINLATTEDIPKPIDIELSELDGVQEHYVENLFKKGQIRTYDSDFANKVFAAIGRKTGSTGCYSNNIECKEGDWFTRSDFGTGIVVVLDENENILGDVANAAYKPTIQIVPSRPSYDFSKAKYVVFVVMLANINSEKIVKGKYIPTEEGDYMTIPRLRIMTSNIGKDMVTYIKSNTGKFYQLQINDSDGAPSIVPIQLQGIPASELPSNFPTFKVTGDFSKYYSGLVLSPIDGVAGYIYEIAPDGLVKRYLNTTAICPRIIKEGETLYYYGVNGSPNSSSGKLNIYKAKDNTFELVKGNLGGGEDGSLLLEPHDCLVLSVSPLHYIYQRYVENQITNVNGEQKRIIALHVGEIYDGTLLYEWHSEDYPELWTDSHSNGDNGDYLHNNTISIDSSGNLYLNNKHANQILVIKRTWNSSEHTASIGEILWKIGGNRTKAGWDVPTRIKTTTEQQWFESHDGIINSNGLITMFDNRASSPSRILEFKIDTSNKLLSDFKSYTYKQYHGRFMGSAEKLDEGVYLVSWGSTRSDGTANAGIYDFKSNKALFEIKFDATGSSAYRIYGIPKE